MMSLQAVFILLAVYVAVFAEAYLVWPRYWVGASVILVAPVMVYAGATSSLPVVCGAAAVGGLCLDSLSANPFGISVLPLASAGLGVHFLRGWVARLDTPMLWAMGAVASAGVPLLTLGLLVTRGEDPLFGGWFAWRWLVSAAVGAALTPGLFRLFAWLNRALNYQPEPSPGFRPDREIERGRDPHAHC
jgi:hypothetical protein